MTARDSILASIRQALAEADTSHVDVPRGYRTPSAHPELLDLFVERVEDYRATVTRCRSSSGVRSWGTSHSSSMAPTVAP